MKIVGKHTEPILGQGHALDSVRTHLETLAGFCKVIFEVKHGAYRFKTHEEMNANMDAILVTNLVRVNLERKKK